MKPFNLPKQFHGQHHHVSRKWTTSRDKRSQELQNIGEDPRYVRKLRVWEGFYQSELRSLINATITEEVGGNLVFSSAEKQISRAITEKWHQKSIGKLLMGLVVGAARVKQVIQCGPPISPPRVYLQDFTLDPLLTEALHNPQILLQSAAYPLNAGYFGSSPTDNDKSTSTYIENVDQEVIVVRRVIDRAKVAWLLILFLLFSPALGIWVGICSHNADVGIAVSAGVFALASFVQGLVAWVQG